eukprot:3519728-Prymnesium_polylepis.1
MPPDAHPRDGLGVRRAVARRAPRRPLDRVARDRDERLRHHRRPPRLPPPAAQRRARVPLDPAAARLLARH